MVPSDASSHHNMRDNPRNPYLLHPEEEEEDEAAAAATEERLSLCDLPLYPQNGRDDDNNTDNDSKRLSNHSPRSHSEPPPDFFEFFSDLSSDMCPADDIFFCGKLIPFIEQSPPTTRQTPKISTAERNHIKHTHFRRRYCQPLSMLHGRPITRSNSSSSTSKLMTRNSHALDYRKLHRRSHSMISPTPEVERNISVRSVGKSDTALKTAAKPRWYFFMFGMVKFPPEMELGDMKNRQVRRNRPSTLFPTPRDVHGKLPVRRNSSKGFWRLLRALSCKDHSSVAVTASFCFPHV